MRTVVHEEAVYQGRKETMRRTGLSRNALMKGERQGIFPHVRVGARVLYNVPAVLAALERMAQEGGLHLMPRKKENPAHRWHGGAGWWWKSRGGDFHSFAYSVYHRPPQIASGSEVKLGRGWTKFFTGKWHGSR